MAYITGESRNQISYDMLTLDELIEEECEVRVIDAYIDSLDLESLGFTVYCDSNRGQRPYNRKDLLKIHLYGYLNGIRSSRKLERECKRNIEVMWLINYLKPDHGTISSFVKHNKKAIKDLFKTFVMFLKGIALVDGKIIAIDGTKLKANNSKHKHLNMNKIKLKLDYLDQKIEEYLCKVDDDKENEAEILEKVNEYKKRIEELEKIKSELKENDTKQVCLTDQDAKSMKNNGRFEPCFNVQSAVDDKHKLIVACDVVSEVNDQSQLSSMVSKAKSNLDIIETTVVADTGYYNKMEMKKVYDDNNILIIKRQSHTNTTNVKEYSIENFEYDTFNDTYICPQGKTLQFECINTKNKMRFKKYRCLDCSNCYSKSKCTTSIKGRTILRWEHEETIEEIEIKTKQNENIYKKRKCIVEHPFGTIKRHLGYRYFLRQGLDSVQAEGSLICIAYNLKRSIKILGVSELLRRINVSTTLTSH